MEKITCDQLRQMFKRVGLEPSQADIDFMIPQVQQHFSRIEVLRSAGLEVEELGGVFVPHWPIN